MNLQHVDGAFKLSYIRVTRVYESNKSEQKIIGRAWRMENRFYSHVTSTDYVVNAMFDFNMAFCLSGRIE